MTSARRIWLTRHGESEYNTRHLLGGDSNLSEKGERYAALLPDVLVSRLPQEGPVSVSVWTSTLKRTIQTARHVRFPKLRWKALDEIDAGICDGMTYEDVKQQFPQEYEMRKKDKLRYRYPSGESYMDVIQRIEPVIIEIERERECVCIVAHQAILRAIYGYFKGVPQHTIPTLDMPLHTLIELTPMPDGSMAEVRIPVDINNAGDISSLMAQAQATSHHHHHAASSSSGGGKPQAAPAPVAVSSHQQVDLLPAMATGAAGDAAAAAHGGGGAGLMGAEAVAVA